MNKTLEYIGPPQFRITKEELIKQVQQVYYKEAIEQIYMQVFFLVILIIFGYLLWKAVKIKAIHGNKDKIIIIVLFLLTMGIGAIIYLWIKINNKKQ